MPRRSPRKRKTVLPRKAKSANKNTKSPRKKKTAKLSRKRSISRRWPYLALFLVLAATAYVAYLDVVIRSQFEGKRWALPAKVYARPLEIYSGMALSRERFLDELRLLGFRYSYQAKEPGAYSQQGDDFVLVTRPFHFWDGREASRHIRVSFRKGRVAALDELKEGRELSILRLEPAIIGRIYPAHHEDRLLIKLEEAPELLIKGLQAIEDRSFYSHHGINPRAIARAILADLRAGRLVQGGSTLTQQLVKNFFLDNRRSLWRKANEAVMALLLEWHYEKDEILEAYLNEIYLGQDRQRAIHGFGLASRFYFDKPLEQLDLPQLATLIALVRGPSYYDPRRNPKRLVKRRNLVLSIMAEQRLISRREAGRAQQAELGVVSKPAAVAGSYPAFMDLVRRQLRRDYRAQDLSSEGLQIFTSFDPHIQHVVEQTLAARIKQLDRQRRLEGQLQGAVVVTDTTTGEILALAGDRNPRYAGFNRALDAKRPIGSLIKPAVYLTALRQGHEFTPASVVDDSPLTLKGPAERLWRPGNYDGKSHGDTPLFMALARSYNQATVRLGLQLGFESIAETLARLGVEREIPPYPSMLLGAVDMSPYEVTRMYQTLAAGGFRSPLRVVREVLTVEGSPLRRFPLKVEQTIEPARIQVLNGILHAATQMGTSRSLQSTLPAGLKVAGKTGTTDDLRDSWFAGFSASHLAVVWLGRDDNQPSGLSGASGALKIWSDIFNRIPTQPLDPLASDELEYCWIDSATGLLSEADCEGAVYLAFIKGTAPVEQSSCRGAANGSFFDRF